MNRLLLSFLARLKQHARLAISKGRIWYLFALLCLATTWLNPVMQQHGQLQHMMYVIDISASMNVPDTQSLEPKYDRLEQAKDFVRQSISGLPCGSKVSIAAFAGDEVVVLFEPLEVCHHFPAIDQVVAKLDTRMRWIGDSWIVRGLAAAIKEASARDNMNIVMLTDGDEMPHHSVPRLNELTPLKGKVKGAIIGFGQETPRPVPKLNGRNETIGYWTPEEAVIEGNHPNLLAYVKELPPGTSGDPELLAEVHEHQSSLNQSLLTAAANTLGFMYFRIDNQINSLFLDNPVFKVDSVATQDARWILAIVSIVLLSIGWFYPKMNFHFIQRRFSLGHNKK